jgi:hypothetical protein
MWKVYFSLTKPSPREANSEINGMKVSISRDSKQLVVENIDACDETDVYQKALTAANQFLDGLWKYNAYLDIDLSQYHVESPTGGKRGYVNLQGSISVTSDLTGILTVARKDSFGNIIEVRDSGKPGRMEIKPSEAATCHRHAHLSHHPFEKFRELYRAAENVASKIQVAKGLSKNKIKQLSESGRSYEEGLLKLALDECFRSDPRALCRAAKRLPEFDVSQEAVPQVARILYEGYRCQLNHSKALREKKIPFNPEDEKEVKDALPLMEFVARCLLQYEENSLLN